MILLADFHVREPAENTLPGLTYSKSPLDSAALKMDPDTMLSQRDYFAKDQPPKVQKVFEHVFPLFYRFLDMKPIPSAMGVQKALGINSGRKTTQDDLPLGERTNAHWFKIKDIEGRKGELQARSEQAAAVS
jgi:hypothetical protein